MSFRRTDSSGIPDDHPLRKLFQDLVQRHLYSSVQLHDAEVAGYVAGVLTDFTRIDRLYPIRNARGRRLEEVVDLLIESNPLLDASSFEREREVRRHIGDFTLFFTGLFPEAVASLPRLRPLSRDVLVDYMAAGKESYRIVAAFNVFEYRREAPLFWRLSEHFEACVFGLNLVKHDLAEMQSDPYGHLRDHLGLDS